MKGLQVLVWLEEHASVCWAGNNGKAREKLYGGFFGRVISALPPSGRNSYICNGERVQATEAPTLAYTTHASFT